MKELVVILVTCSLVISAYHQQRCSDCISLKYCTDGLKLLNLPNPVTDAELSQSFCGHGVDHFPKVCCSSLSEDNNNLENHPNINLLPKECGTINGERIIGGKTAGLYEFPWMSLISFETRVGLQFLCGGSIINERYILTAAHCIVGRKIAGVRIGEHDIRTVEDCQGTPPKLVCESKLQDIRVEEKIVHPNYNPSPKNRNDIALLRLAKPIDFTSKNAFPVCLPISEMIRKRDVEGENATIAGWGYTEKGYFSSVLQVIKIPIYNHNDCEAYSDKNGGHVPNLPFNKLCAGEVGKDSCTGDSGGPLVVIGNYNNVERYIQHGVTSTGPLHCGTGAPGFYTDVTKYVKWILDTIK